MTVKQAQCLLGYLGYYTGWTNAAGGVTPSTAKNSPPMSIPRSSTPQAGR